MPVLTAHRTSEWQCSRFWNTSAVRNTHICVQRGMHTCTEIRVESVILLRIRHFFAYYILTCKQTIYAALSIWPIPECLYQFRRLQSVINAATRSIYNLRWSERQPWPLAELRWFNAVDRVIFKVATLMYRCLHDFAPPYLSTTLHRYGSVMDSGRRLWSSADTA